MRIYFLKGCVSDIRPLTSLGKTEDCLKSCFVRDGAKWQETETSKRIKCLISPLLKLSDGAGTRRYARNLSLLYKLERDRDRETETQRETGREMVVVMVAFPRVREF